MKQGRSDWDVTKVEPPLKVSFGDFMWIMRVLDNRVRGGQAGKMLKELSKYPLKSSCMDLLIKQISRGRLSSLAEECVSRLGDMGVWS